MSALGGDDHAAALREFGKQHSAASAILVVSAHWQIPRPLRATSWEHAPLIYDFGGFPEELYRIQYPAPGDPQLAARVAELLGGNVTLESRRGLDHGAWVPLRLTWPEATIPVVELSLPEAPPAEILQLGQALRPLRDEGVIVAGSGGIVHNLSRVRLANKSAPVDSWAAEFDEWVAAATPEELVDYQNRGPNARLAVPSSEHFDPIFIALGAGYPEERRQTIFAGFQYGNLSMRSFCMAG
jgi:4,5-DOPA dioxygenase extradiol